MKHTKCDSADQRAVGTILMNYILIIKQWRNRNMIFWYIYGIVMILIWIMGAIIASEEIGETDTFMMMMLIGATWLPVLILGLLVFIGQVISDKISRWRFEIRDK